jgi:hypothetical protein
MRQTALISLFALGCFALAGCGGGQVAVTATPEPQAPETTQEAFLIPQLQATVQIPLPGTLIMPEMGFTPGATRAPFTFTSVQLELQNVSLNSSSVIDVFPDGRVVVDGVTAQVSGETVEALRGLLEAISIYELQGIFVNEGGATTGYRYYLTVDGPLGSRTVTADDGSTPEELLAIFTLIIRLGELVSAPEATPAS